MYFALENIAVTYSIQVWAVRETYGEYHAEVAPKTVYL
jgi:hypothetical protein